MRLLQSVFRSPIGHLIIGWVFAHMSFAIPVKRICETEYLLAFYHPKPVYPVHILMVPKKAISSLLDLKTEDNAFLADVFHTAQSLVEELQLTEPGYRIILNGGEFQEVPQLHFHLVSGSRRGNDH